jgi:carnitine 3-dehydrogenase
MAFGPALRWVLVGPFLTFHLGAQDRGIRGYLGNLGAAHLKMFKALGKVRDLSPDIVEAIATGVDRETGGAPILKLLQQRDLALTALLAYMESEAGRLLR